MTKCKSCRGKGKTSRTVQDDCYRCSGRGYYDEIRRSKLVTIHCAHCGYSGKLKRVETQTCNTCGGSGKDSSPTHASPKRKRASPKNRPAMPPHGGGWRTLASIVGFFVSGALALALAHPEPSVPFGIICGIVGGMLFARFYKLVWLGIAFCGLVALLSISEQESPVTSNVGVSPENVSPRRAPSSRNSSLERQIREAAKTVDPSTTLRLEDYIHTPGESGTSKVWFFLGALYALLCYISLAVGGLWLFRRYRAKHSPAKHG